MRKVPLGKTGEDVSILCLGAMYMGAREDEATSFRLLDQYVDAGGSFIDTANIYSHWVPGGEGGESEQLLGKWMRQRNNRGKMFNATKVGLDYSGVARGLSAAQIEAEFDKSLRRLGVDVVDLYYAHADDRHTPLEETLQAFDRLVRAGKVRHIGASNYMAWRLEAARGVSHAHGWPEYVCVQQRFTYLRPKPGSMFDPQIAASDELLDYCQARNLRLIAYSPLLSGAYTRPGRMPPQYICPDLDARMTALQSLAAECGSTPSQVVLAWMMQSDPSVIPLFGASSDEQLHENLAALDLCLTQDQMARLNAATG